MTGRDICLLFFVLCQLLVSLVSAYRYEGPRVREDVAKSEANELHQAIKNAGKKFPVEDDEVVRILSTRSKLHIKSVYKHYKELFGTYLDQVYKDEVVTLIFTGNLESYKKKGTSEG